MENTNYKPNRKERRTRKAIYAKYGISYDTKTQKIFAPINGGMWINPPLVNGNDKIGKGAWHFSMLPGNMEWHVNIALIKKWKISENKKSKMFGKLVSYTGIDENNPIYVDVKGTCVCTCKGCYAFTGNYNYDTTIAYLAIRTMLARDYMEFLENAIMAQIDAEKIKLCRIHAAGDFFCDAYVEMWQRIAKSCVNTIFWTYTKVKEYETAFDGISNANIVKSFIRVNSINGFNFGHCDYIMECYRVLTEAGKKVHICFCGIEKAAGIEVKHCTNCKSCSECDYVLFLEHSTEYVAEKDPLFPELVKLILTQVNQ